MKLVNYAYDLNDLLTQIDQSKINAIMEMIWSSFGRQVFIIGNGGSASTASHMACDFSKGTIPRDQAKINARINAISLTDNAAIMTAWSNDLTYDIVFSEQLKIMAKKDDLLIAISASGNSRNIVRALEMAKEKKLGTVGLFGFDGGCCKDMVDIAIVVPTNSYGLAEDAHSIISHYLTYELKERLQLYENPKCSS